MFYRAPVSSSDAGALSIVARTFGASGAQTNGDALRGDEPYRSERPLKTAPERQVRIIKGDWQPKSCKAGHAVLADAARDNPFIVGEIGIDIEAYAVA